MNKRQRYAANLLAWFARNRTALEACRDENKEIDYLDETTGKWRHTTSDFEWCVGHEYRPRQEEKARPYNQAECEALLKVRRKDSGRVMSVSVVDTESGLVFIHLANGMTATPTILLEEFENLDGTPCGVKKTDKGVAG